MKRSQKNKLIWLAFGLLLAVKIAEAIRHPQAMTLLDWLLILLGVAVAILHYVPDQMD